MPTIAPPTGDRDTHVAGPVIPTIAPPTRDPDTPVSGTLPPILFSPTSDPITPTAAAPLVPAPTSDSGTRRQDGVRRIYRIRVIGPRPPLDHLSSDSEGHIEEMVLSEAHE
jgi:hypothetical protein